MALLKVFDPKKKTKTIDVKCNGQPRCRLQRLVNPLMPVFKRAERKASVCNLKRKGRNRVSKSFVPKKIANCKKN